MSQLGGVRSPFSLVPSNRLVALGLAAGLAALLAAPASSHEALFEIEGDEVEVRTNGAPGDNLFRFSVSEQEILMLNHDPTADGAALLVRGLGQSSGRSELIDLPASGWSGDFESGYTYSDPSGAMGGVTQAAIGGGALSIDASGQGWSWSPGGAQDEVWVHVRVEEEWYCSQFAASTNASFQTNMAGHVAATNADAPVACPVQLCGNGIHEIGEECDDGDLDDEDGCDSQCRVPTCDGEEYDTTFQAIQSVIFDGYQCTNVFCHGDPESGARLDLRPSFAYDNLIDVPTMNFLDPVDQVYVEPGEPAASFLYKKVAAFTDPELLSPVEESPMPEGFDEGLTPEHLEALYKWIRAGAPEDNVVEGTAELLGTCLPPDDPQKLDPPVPPGPGVGVQLQQTAYKLLSDSEVEGCLATYYDFTQTDLVPEEEQYDCSWPTANNPSGKCFRYDKQVLRQDAQSHHSIIHIYAGEYDGLIDAPNARDFAPFTFKRNDVDAVDHGASCDPSEIDPALGYNPDCSGRFQLGVACIGNYGPPDFSTGTLGVGGDEPSAPMFSGSQETYYEQDYAQGVYSELPMSGIVVWNSHAFNLTAKDTTMNQYLDLFLAEPEEQDYPVQGIFDGRFIFYQYVPPFQDQELCATFTLPQGARLFNLSSHTHRHGIRFRIWEPPNERCSPDGTEGGVFGGGSPVMPVCELGGPSEQLVYYSTSYSDPVQLNYELPVALDDADEAMRTYKYCGLFDNETEPGRPEVKRRSASPPAIIGGPCRMDEVACMAGPRQGEACGEVDGQPDHAFCDSFPGSEDGDCDACPVRGGVTTEDEMFLLLGNYYVTSVPEPGLGLMQIGALAGIGGLAARRRRA